MVKKAANDDTQRSCRPRAAGELVTAIGGQSFKRFGFMHGAIVSRWAEIVGQRYARVTSPESIRFPAGKKAGGALTLLVEGAHAPLVQHSAPLIIERVNQFFGHQAIDRIVFRQGRARPAPERVARPASAAIPRELGEGLREIADPGLRACLESLAAKIAATTGPPVLPEGDPILPSNNRSTHE